VNGSQPASSSLQPGQDRSRTERDDGSHSDAVASGAEEEERLIDGEADSGEHHESEGPDAEDRPGRSIRSVAGVAPGQQECQHSESGPADHHAHDADRQGSGVVRAQRLRSAGGAEQQRSGEDGEDVQHHSVVSRSGVQVERMPRR
jgi:hypothetical protein